METSFVVEAASMLSQSHVTDEYVKMLMQQNKTARRNNKKQRRNSLNECSGDIPVGTENSYRSKY